MRIAALGDRDPTYLTHRELDAAFALLAPRIDCAWVGTDTVEAGRLEAVDGVWLLPGTPYRNDDAAFAAIRYCIDTGTPFLGTCGGFQYACIELARAGGVSGAAHAELDPEAPELIVAPLRCLLYGECRTVTPVSGSRLAEICGAEPFDGFHWCGYGLADPYIEALANAGALASAFAEDVGVEAIELPSHPFFIATAFQPQVGSSETGRLHPLIQALVDAVHGRAARPRRAIS